MKLHLNGLDSIIKFEVSIPDYAGPMDLLVFLVRRRELDVAYISISAITQDFLEWLDRLEVANLDIAGDFILLASTLIQFKVFNLLPGSQPELSEAERIEQPRTIGFEELEGLRETASKLAELEENQINLFERGNVHLAGVDEKLTDELISDVSLLDLALAFRDAIYKLPEEPTYILEESRYTLEGQIAFIKSYFGDNNKLSFTDLSSVLESRLAVIMTFLAILELIRIGQLRVVQAGPFEPLWLVK